jgi:hypothetical protein
MSGWLLKTVAIEGLRGINNEGDPLKLHFTPNGVNSIFAPNSVGKSSIYDALLFAIRGRIKKLDDLPTAERGKDYYRNRFHSTGLGFVELTLASSSGQPDITIRVSLGLSGERVVSSSDVGDPENLLSSLNREFALLDYQTFQRFITDNPTDRGRSFAGLLGLDPYSRMRQNLQGLANTRAFNNKFDVVSLENEIRGKDQTIGTNTVLAHKTAAGALGKKPEDFTSASHITAEIEAKLCSTVPVDAHCKGKKLSEVDFDACLTRVLDAEGGEKKNTYSSFVTERAALQELSSNLISNEDLELLSQLATELEKALEQTTGSDRLAVFKATERVLGTHEWENKALCPACDEIAGKSVLEHVQAQLELFEAAQQAATKLSEHIRLKALASDSLLEKRFIQPDEESPFKRIERVGTQFRISSTNASLLTQWLTTLRGRLEVRIQVVDAEKAALEKELPESLVTVTKLVEDSRTITRALAAVQDANNAKALLDTRRKRVQRLKTFLDAASGAFADAEGRATQRRLKKVQPLARSLFSSIMSSEVVPDVKKSSSDESLTIYLDTFFGKPDLSALALLSESYRNAFSISLYLSAASLYGGAAKFVVLDDVTSSFDGGHQFLLMEVIKTHIARPTKPDGLQFVILSHDTLLEKLFQKNSQSPGWDHQKIEGTPKLLVTPVVGASANIKSVTQKHLSLGRLDEAARGIRMILEGKLLEIISRVNIPVPLDFAINDHTKMADAALKAIRLAIDLHKSAGNLIMTPSQQATFSTNAIAAIGNFLSHYATGSTSTFSGSALSQVITAIDSLGACFQMEDPAGSGAWRYYKSLSQA